MAVLHLGLTLTQPGNVVVEVCLFALLKVTVKMQSFIAVGCVSVVFCTTEPVAAKLGMLVQRW